MKDLDRRKFLRASASFTAGATLVPSLLGPTSCGSISTSAALASSWDATPDRVWIGPEFWANPLQDWRIFSGRVECSHAAVNRQLHLLTREVGEGSGLFTLRVRIGRTGGLPFGEGSGSAGFRIGYRGPLPGYRNALMFGSGLNAGLKANGSLFIGDGDSPQAVTLDLGRSSVELHLTGESGAEGAIVTLIAHDGESGELLGQVTQGGLPAAALTGGLALIANFPAPGTDPRPAASSPDAGTFWFADWQADGPLLTAHDDRAFGPILFTQYTLSRRVMKMTAQMPPLGSSDEQKVRLEIERDGEWLPAAEAVMDPSARTATFRVESWDDTRDTPYRVLYSLRRTDGRAAKEHSWGGTVRRDPADQPRLTVADISCNAHYAFPNTDCVEGVTKLNPDLLAFTGDQYYESTGGYGALLQATGDRAVLDMLRKWYQHGWTWRELLRGRPSVSIPDDHDVYHGNLWGEGGSALETGKSIDGGGYRMSPEFVNAVHRTQTAHHPDVFDPAPSKRGVSVYFGDLVYGRVSFAIIADRQFKTGPDGAVPATGGRADHVTDPRFNPRAADLPGLELLGDRQLAFLRAWASDWKGADMKAVISQTIFTAMATTHGRQRERLVADYDTNGWPQRARNEALREMRRAFAPHLAGDQHLPAVVHYGIDGHRDGPVAFASPAINNLYPRWFEPQPPGAQRPEGAPKVLGDFSDSFGNPLTVLAVANPQLVFREGVREAEMDKSSGFGVVRFDKQARTITVECWPLLADPAAGGSQFPGWPVSVSQWDNYGATVAALLPKLLVSGTERPVVQVRTEPGGEVLYTLRAPERDWQPPVFAPGRYSVRVSDPETGRSVELSGLEATAQNADTREVTLT